MTCSMHPVRSVASSQACGRCEKEVPVASSGGRDSAFVMNRVLTASCSRQTSNDAITSNIRSPRGPRRHICTTVGPSLLFTVLSRLDNGCPSTTISSNHCHHRLLTHHALESRLSFTTYWVRRRMTAMPRCSKQDARVESRTTGSASNMRYAAQSSREPVQKYMLYIIDTARSFLPVNVIHPG